MFMANMLNYRAGCDCCSLTNGRRAQGKVAWVKEVEEELDDMTTNEGDR